MVYFSLLSAVFILILLPCIAARMRIDPRLWSALNWLINNKGKKLPYSTTENYGAGKGLIYCPHPFTNWSLNPSYVNKFNEKEHTREGFRKTGSEDSIKDMLKKNPGAYKIVCIGGSTTYCTGISRYSDSWPSLLNKKANKNTIVFNFGVAHWTTIQSIIRCMGWLPVIKPDLAILYQAKNDLNPLNNTRDEEKYVYPDYQNVMDQFSQGLNLRFPKWLLTIPLFSMLELWRLKRLDFSCLYKVKSGSMKLDKFLDNNIIQSIVFRIEIFIKMCESINCRLLYIPEIVRSGKYREALHRHIYSKVPEIIGRYDNADLLEIAYPTEEADEFFDDKMHFSIKGSRFFADTLAGHINKLRK